MKKNTIAFVVWFISAILGGLAGLLIYETSYDVREWFRPHIRTPILMILFGIIVGSIVSGLLLSLVIFAKKSTVESINNTEENRDVSNMEIETIMEFKELLDSGLITREEFDAKKKQILNI